jgi:hypothetical protein
MVSPDIEPCKLSTTSDVIWGMSVSTPRNGADRGNGERAPGPQGRVGGTRNTLLDALFFWYTPYTR